MSHIFYERQVIEVTPTIDTSAYASGDHMGTLMTLSTGRTFELAHNGLLETVSVLAKDSTKNDFTIFFFDASPTVTSTDNDPLDISDAEMADKALGWVQVTTEDFQDLANSALATVRGVNLPLKSTTGIVYAQMMANEAQTYAAATDLTLKFIVRSG